MLLYSTLFTCKLSNGYSLLVVAVADFWCNTATGRWKLTCCEPCGESQGATACPWNVWSWRVVGWFPSVRLAPLESHSQRMYLACSACCHPEWWLTWYRKCQRASADRHSVSDCRRGTLFKRNCGTRKKCSSEDHFVSTSGLPAWCCSPTWLPEKGMMLHGYSVKTAGSYNMGPWLKTNCTWMQLAHYTTARFVISMLMFDYFGDGASKTLHRAPKSLAETLRGISGQNGNHSAYAPECHAPRCMTSYLHDAASCNMHALPPFSNLHAWLVYTRPTWTAVFKFSAHIHRPRLSCMHCASSIYKYVVVGEVKLQCWATIMVVLVSSLPRWMMVIWLRSLSLIPLLFILWSLLK